VAATGNRGGIYLGEETKSKKIHYAVDISIISMLGKTTFIMGFCNKVDGFVKMAAQRRSNLIEIVCFIRPK